MKLTIPFLPRNSSFDFLHRNYRIIEYVGKGQFGNTYLVENTKDYKIWLAKCIDLSQMDEDDKKRSLQEAEIMKSISHPYVIKCHESFMHDDVYLVIIMEYCENGDIGALIDSCISKGTYLEERTILHWCAQLAAGLYYLHNECRIIHRDIKPSNIFIRDNGDLVIGDFGISRIMLSVTMPFTLTSIGTPQYMSPEMCENKPYTYKSDIWSFGCVLYELTCLKPPFSGDSLISLAWKISFQEIEPLPSCYSCDLFQFIQGLLSRDPILRPDPKEILSNKLIREFTNLSKPVSNVQANCVNNEIRPVFHGINQEAEKSCCKRLQSGYQEMSVGETIGRLEARQNSTPGADNRGIKAFSGESYPFFQDETGTRDGYQCRTSCGCSRNCELASLGGNSCPDPSLQLDNTYKCNYNEVRVSEGEELRDYCDRLTNYEHQYFSVLVGRIQHHILRYSDKFCAGGVSDKADILDFLMECFNPSQADLCSLDGYMTPEWFSGFVEELGVGFSESEVSLFLAYIGHFIHSEADDSYLEFNKDSKGRGKCKIRCTRSSGNLISFGGSRNVTSMEPIMSESSLEMVELGEGIGYSPKNGHGSRSSMPKIYDFIKKIYTWNKVRFNKMQSHRELDFDDADNGPDFFPVSPVINYHSEKLAIQSVRPCFYLFITDWIQSILTPILALNNITYSSNQSARRLEKITLRQGFHLFDQKVQGSLSRQHFRTVLYLILPRLTSVQLDWLYALAPKDLSGNVKYEQFLEFIENIQKPEASCCSGSLWGGSSQIESRDAQEGECQSGKFSEMDKQQCGQLESIRSTMACSESQRNEVRNLEEGGSTKGGKDQVGGKIDEGQTLCSNFRLGGGAGGLCDLQNIQHELYGFGIQDVVLLHYNSSACMNRPSPSPQLLARARTASLIRSSRRGGYSKPDLHNKENTLKLNVDSSVVEIRKKHERFKRLEPTRGVKTDSLEICSSPHQSDGKMNRIGGQYKPLSTAKRISSKLIGSLSKELENLIQKLQIERIYTCWITAKASESQEDLFAEVFERLASIRLGTSLALDLMISSLENVNSKELFGSILELGSVLMILREELPLQRDAIDCILRVIDHVKSSSDKDGALPQEILSVGSHLNSNASKAYTHIMKQAITSNIVLPIPSKGKYCISKSLQGASEDTSANKSQQLVQNSKVFDWSGRFLASFEFFGEATVNLIQCGICILESTRSLREGSLLEETSLRNFSQLNLLIENYRQWSYLKEHVSRECAFVASIGANHDIKNDMETARIFLELLGARRFQVNVTWQKQSSVEQQLFRELFLLEESLWNNQQFYPIVDNTLLSKRKSDSELWLVCGEQTCGALHHTCNRFIDEIQSLL
ncbi:NIMA-related kinase 5 [Cryptosporidium canis]|uniref:non-specific serine/threonine protein kinase n=1 Tax=Cryptosporidium canis TaxID=195482 RepID=A0A9D5DLE1_9CRYT|nr:NIMA-related kinase 5 [Cryptosporidium canis]